MIPLIITFKFRELAEFSKFGESFGLSKLGQLGELSQLILPKCLDLYINTGRQIQFHQRVDRFGGWVEDVHKTLVCPDLELLTRLFINVRGSQDRPFILDRR